VLELGDPVALILATVTVLLAICVVPIAFAAMVGFG
jgi:hypothetical protein